MLGYDHFLTRLGYSSLFNLGEPSHSLSLSSRPTTPTKLEDLFLSHLVDNEIRLLTHQRLLSEEAGYIQFDQLSVVIEDSRWQLFYLVVTQVSKKRYSLISVKNCCYCRFFILFFCQIKSSFVSCSDQTYAFALTSIYLLYFDIYQHSQDKALLKLIDY